jgi:hypothetical protein
MIPQQFPCQSSPTNVEQDDTARCVDMTECLRVVGRRKVSARECATCVEDTRAALPTLSHQNISSLVHIVFCNDLH